MSFGFCYKENTTAERFMTGARRILPLGRYSIAIREKHCELISQREALHKKSDTTLLKQVVSHDQLTSGTLARH